MATVLKGYIDYPAEGEDVFGLDPNDKLLVKYSLYTGDSSFQGDHNISAYINDISLGSFPSEKKPNQTYFEFGLFLDSHLRQVGGLRKSGEQELRLELKVPVVGKDPLSLTLTRKFNVITPVLTITTAPNDVFSLGSLKMVNISGKVDGLFLVPSVAVYVNGKKYETYGEVLQDNTWEIAAEVPGEGTHILTILAEDVQGNATEKDIPIITHKMTAHNWDKLPLAMLPLRLETRLLGNELWVRVFPDQIFFDMHARTLSAAECNDGVAYWSVVKSGGKKRDAWRKLAKPYGSKRAAWIVRSTKNANSSSCNELRSGTRIPIPKLPVLPDCFNVFVYPDSDTFKDKPLSFEGNPITPNLSLLPLHDPVVYSGQASSDPTKLQGKVINAKREPIDNLAIKSTVTKNGRQTFQKALTSKTGEFTITAIPADQQFVDIELSTVGGLPRTVRVDKNKGAVTIFANENMLAARWMTDLNQAEADGMAICIDLGNNIQKIDRLIVVGMMEGEATARLEQILDAHHFTDGLGFVRVGTPTNNTESGPSGFSALQDDPEKSYDIEVEDPTRWHNLDLKTEHTNAWQLGTALGLRGDSPYLKHLENAGDVEVALSKEMRAAIWPLVGRYFLSDLLKNVFSVEDLKNLKNFFINWVVGSGPLPSLRIGTHPYGILPALPQRWGADSFDQIFVTYTPFTTENPNLLKGVIQNYRNKSFHIIITDADGVEVTTDSDGKFECLIDAIAKPDAKNDEITYEPVMFKLPFDNKDELEYAFEVKVGEGELEIYFDKYLLKDHFDSNIKNILTNLFEAWLNISKSVPKIKNIPQTDDQHVVRDPEGDLIRFLQMQPVSTGYNVRPVVDKSFVELLLENLRYCSFVDSSKVPPRELVRQWKKAWDNEKGNVAKVWSNITGKKELEGKLNQSDLFKSYDWWADKDISEEGIQSNFTASSDHLDAVEVLERLVPSEKDTKCPPEPEKSLLYNLISAALCSGNEKNTEVQKALERLLYAYVINYLNEVKGAEDIVLDIKDDPRFQKKAPHAYGIRTELASRIIEKRNNLGGKFTTIHEIAGIKGMRTDTMNDLIRIVWNKVALNPDIDRIFRESLDLFSHRLDAWITALAYKRLMEIRQTTARTGICLGAYGWVEDLKLTGQKERISYGYIHAPSRGQAATAAVLHNAFLTHGTGGEEEPFRINLNSERVRRGMQIVDGIRQGQSLGAMLGYQFERALHEHTHHGPNLDQYIDDFRSAFPLKGILVDDSIPEDAAETISPRNVVDGLALAKWRENPQGNDNILQLLEGNESLATEVDNLVAGLDAISDLLLFESVHHSISGNFDRADAAMGAAAGNGMPPEIESMSTPVSGRSFTQRVCWFFPPAEKQPEIGGQSNGHEDTDTISLNPREAGEPRIAAWISKVIGQVSALYCEYSFKTPKIDLNHCTVEQLFHLPGIPFIVAGKILERRKKVLFFKEWAEVWPPNDPERNTYLPRLQQWCTLEQASGKAVFYERININTATQQVFSKLLGWSKEMALAVVSERTKNGPYGRIEALERAGIPHDDITRLRPFLITSGNKVAISKLGLTAADLLYIAANLANGRSAEIDQRVALFTRMEYGLTHDIVVHVSYATVLEKALYICSQVFRTLGASQPLGPKSLALASAAEKISFDMNSAADLRKRILKVMDDLRDLLTVKNGDPQQSPISPKLPFTPEETNTLLQNAARFGIPLRMLAGLDDPEGKELCKSAVEEIRKRLFTCQQLLSDTEAKDTDGKIALLTKAMKALLGENFVVLPQISASALPEALTLQNAQTENQLLAGIGAARLDEWLQQAAPVHTPLRNLDDIRMLLETNDLPTRPAGSLSLHVTQQPFRPDDTRWMGLSDAERKDGRKIHDLPKEETLSLITVNGSDSMPQWKQGVAGVLIDQWNEFIPNKQIQTGLSYHYQTPNAQAPQAILLAVPPRRGENWAARDLADVAYHTLDLAKVRAVDLEAMSNVPDTEKSALHLGIGTLLPAVFMSNGSSNLGNTIMSSLLSQFSANLIPLREIDFSKIFIYYSTETGIIQDKAKVETNKREWIRKGILWASLKKLNEGETDFHKILFYKADSNFFLNNSVWEFLKCNNLVETSSISAGSDSLYIELENFNTNLICLMVWVDESFSKDSILAFNEYGEDICIENFYIFKKEGFEHDLIYEYIEYYNFKDDYESRITNTELCLITIAGEKINSILFNQKSFIIQNIALSNIEKNVYTSIVMPGIDDSIIKVDPKIDKNGNIIPVEIGITGKININEPVQYWRSQLWYNQDVTGVIQNKKVRNISGIMILDAKKIDLIASAQCKVVIYLSYKSYVDVPSEEKLKNLKYWISGIYVNSNFDINSNLCTQDLLFENTQYYIISPGSSAEMLDPPKYQVFKLTISVNNDLIKESTINSIFIEKAVNDMLFLLILKIDIL